MSAAWQGGDLQPVRVRRGPWRFELRGDEIADLSFDSSPVLRGIRAVARDGDWNTVPCVVESVVGLGCDTGSEAGDELLLRLTMRGFGAELTAELRIAAGDDAITVDVQVESHTDFLSNRIGLVLLHPAGIAGVPLLVTNSTGRTEQTAFPAAVAPHQPALDIAALDWRTDGVEVSARFSGDVFEMEDQRNWTDASFKTYSTPLARPFPVLVARGDVRVQAIELRARRTAPSLLHQGARPAFAVRLADVGRAIPELFLGATTAPCTHPEAPLPPGVAGILVELELGSASWRVALARAAEESGGRALDVRIVVGDAGGGSGALAEAVEALRALGAGRIARVGVFSAESHLSELALLEELDQLLAERLPGVVIVGGVRSHYTELNRGRAALPASAPSVAFSMTPQMHSNDQAQIVESIAMQALLVREAALIAAGRPLHIGPITLRPRFNAVRTGAAAPRAGSTEGHAEGETEAVLAAGYGAELVPGATDRRQSAPALAAWTVASFAAVAGSGAAASVSYFEVSGARGLADEGGAFAVAGAIAQIGALAGGSLLVPGQPGDDGLWVIGARLGDGTWSALAANLTGEDRIGTVRLGEDERRVDVPAFGVAAV